MPRQRVQAITRYVPRRLAQIEALTWIGGQPQGGSDPSAGSKIREYPRDPWLKKSLPCGPCGHGSRAADGIFLTG